MAEKKDKPEKVEKTLTTSYNVKPLTQSDKRKVVIKFLIYFLLALGLVSAIFYL